MTPVLQGLSMLVAAAFGAAAAYLLLGSRHQAELSRQREELAAARAGLKVQQETLESSLRNAEESARHKAMDEFLAEIRVEERTYTREHKMLFMVRKSLVRQERIYFRSIPLSNWVEQEMPFEEGADVDLLAKTMAVFAAELPAPDSTIPVRRLLR